MISSFPEGLGNSPNEQMSITQSSLISRGSRHFGSRGYRAKECRFPFLWEKSLSPKERGICRTTITVADISRFSKCLRGLQEVSVIDICYSFLETR